MSALDKFIELVGQDNSPLLSEKIIDLYDQISKEEKRLIVNRYRTKAEEPWKQGGADIGDVYRSKRGPQGTSAYNLGQNDIGIRYAKHLQDKEVLKVLEQGQSTLKDFEVSTFKQIVAGLENKEAKIDVIAGYDSILKEQNKVDKEIERRKRIIEQGGSLGNNKKKVTEGSIGNVIDNKKSDNRNSNKDNNHKVEKPTRVSTTVTVGELIEHQKNKTYNKESQGKKTDQPTNKYLSLDVEKFKNVEESIAKTSEKNTQKKKANSALDSNREKANSAYVGSGKTIAEKLANNELVTLDDVIKETTGKHAREEAIRQGEIKIKNMEAEAKMLKASKYLPTAMKVGAGVVGLATLLDVGGVIKDKREEKKMKAAAEKRLVDNQKKEEESYKKYSYGYVDAGEIAFELFNNRSGHHKMGNAKFY